MANLETKQSCNVSTNNEMAFHPELGEEIIVEREDSEDQITCCVNSFKDKSAEQYYVDEPHTSENFLDKSISFNKDQQA